MKLVKKTSEYTISLRRDGRHAVVDANKQPINGEEKVKILTAENLVKVAAPAPVAEPEPEATTEEAAAVEEDSAAE